LILKILRGLGASPGLAKGMVRIVTGEKDEPQFLEAEILVTRITDPTMVMMMNGYHQCNQGS
jgi:pyruvate, water dikinase